MIGRLSRLRLSIRGVMVLTAVAAVALATGGWIWRSFFSPTHRWLRTVHDPDGGIGRWGIVMKALQGKDPAVSPELATSALIDALGDLDRNVRRDAASSLGLGARAAEPAVPALIAALHDPESEVRVGAARSLGGIIAAGGQGRERAIPALMEALGDRTYWVRQEAATALGLVVGAAEPEADDVSAALESRLADPKPIVRMSACWSLTRLGRVRRCLSVLIDGLQSPDMSARSLAVGTLADAGTVAAEAIPALEARLPIEDNAVILGEIEKLLARLQGEAESQEL